MAKSKITMQIERELYHYCAKLGQFPVEEVLISNSLGMVDTLSFQTDYSHRGGKNLWRCFEIKVSKSDFYSKAKKTFCGNFNYYVMPKDLYPVVIQNVPTEIGVLCFDGKNLYSVSKAKRQELTVNENTLFRQFIGSMAREVWKAKLVEKGLDIYTSDDLLKEIKKRGDFAWRTIKEEIEFESKDEIISDLKDSIVNANVTKMLWYNKYKEIENKFYEDIHNSK
jgi:hypothetical protein